jgi:hypothetical protein
MGSYNMNERFCNLKKRISRKQQVLSFCLSRDAPLEPVECLLQQIFEYAFINHGSETASLVSVFS